MAFGLVEPMKFDLTRKKLKILEQFAL